MRFEKLRQKALKEWEAIKTSRQPVITIGTATCGRAAGALKVLEAVNQELLEQNITAQVIQVGCMGHCYAEPLMIVTKTGNPPIAYGYVTPGMASVIIKNYLAGDDNCLEFALGAMETNELIPTIFDLPRFQYEKRVILHNCGYIDPESINHYIASDGYTALNKSLSLKPEEILKEIKKSGLRGRGGSGFSTGTKWEIVRNASDQPKYIICNADEGDPGAFMDRAILESDPHSVIEGMIIAAYTIGASNGFIYVRAEYPLAVKMLTIALKQAYESGLLGKNILESGFNFNIEIYRGSGAFVCGEETALIASIEGRRGMPEHRPPYPAEYGLWGKPTLINNVKTFTNIPPIISNGASWFSSTGTENSKGTAVFALAGKIMNTGLVEVPMGTSLRNIIYKIGSGIPNNKQFKAVQIGGPSGGCIPESLLDTPVDFDSLKKAGAIMGSGGLVILDEDNCMVEAARYFLDFTQKESCGKCTMCRLGTKHMLIILERIVQGEGKQDDLELLAELAEDIKQGSLCGLGKTAPNPVLTTLKYFHDEYISHIVEKRCPALSCQKLISYYILPEKCERSCDACVGICTAEAIYSGKNMVKIVDQSKCVKCGTCIEACPPQYRAIIRLSPANSVPKPAEKK